MEALCLQEHLNCFGYEVDPGKAQIEVLEFEKDQRMEISVNFSTIIFFVSGEVSLTFANDHKYEGTEKEFIFLMGEKTITLQALTGGSIIVSRLNNIFNLCEFFPIENLYAKDRQSVIQYRLNLYQIKPLYMHDGISVFLDNLAECIKEGLCCTYFFELKIREFFLLLRVLYPKEELAGFFTPMLSVNITFLEHVYRNWEKYPTARQLAASLNMTPKNFLTKFKVVFGTTPYQWMKQAKARTIHSELMDRNKPIKLIAENNGFTDMSQFSAFCKKELGVSPSKFRKNGIGRTGY